MSTIVEYPGDVPILIETSAPAPGGGVRAVGVASQITSKAAASLKESLRMIGGISDAVRGALADARVHEAEVKIGLKASGTGQFVVAQSTLEGAIEVTFKVKVGD